MREQRAQGGFPSVPCGTACAAVDCALGSHSVAALLEHRSLTVIDVFLFRTKKLVSIEDAPSAPLRREDKYPCMLMVSRLMEN